MANSQKYMVYIAPLFALSGLYWQFGLVMYWMTSNIWQLGQQYFLFKKIPPLDKAPAPATAGAGVPGKAPAAAIQPAARAKTGSTQAGRAKAGNAQAARRTGRPPSLVPLRASPPGPRRPPPGSQPQRPSRPPPAGSREPRRASRRRSSRRPGRSLPR